MHVDYTVMIFYYTKTNSNT